MTGLVAIFIFAAVTLAQPPPPPGLHCPVDDRVTTCECRPEFIQCNDDSQCPGVQKCCSWGCGCRRACVDPVIIKPPVGKSCRYNGRVYRVGQTFPATDGCNSCTCMNFGGVICTTRPCRPICHYNGKQYTPGSVFPASNGCGTCTCDSMGSVECFDVDCDDRNEA